MTTGRRPTPTAIKEARGKPGHRPLPEDEPKLEAVKGSKPPAFLNAAAKKHWHLIAPMLEQARILTIIDAPALALFCQQFVRYITARDLSDAEGLTMWTHTGHLVIRPELDIMDRAHDRMLKILMEYGCTPASRTRVKTANATDEKKNRFAAGANDGEDE